ncbi:MAG: hypothetical protein AB7F59_02325 [Bdellovibrionales bacterium]
MFKINLGILTTLCLLTVSAKADKYGDLEKLYQTGSLPSYASIANGYSGRCYLVGNNVGAGALSFGLFSNGAQKAVFYSEKSLAPDYFDVLTIETVELVRRLTVSIYPYNSQTMNNSIYSESALYNTAMGEIVTRAWWRMTSEGFVTKVEDTIKNISGSTTQKFFCQFIKRIN